MHFAKLRTIAAGLLFVVAWYGIGSASGWVPDRKAPDVEATPPLQGVWRLTHSEFEGQTQSETSNQWVITADTITIMIAGQNRGSWRYTVNTLASPAALDLTPSNRPNLTYPSAFRLDGDRLTVCLQNFPERGRPKDLISRPGSGIGKFIYERLK